VCVLVVFESQYVFHRNKRRRLSRTVLLYLYYLYTYTIISNVGSRPADKVSRIIFYVSTIVTIIDRQPECTHNMMYTYYTDATSDLYFVSSHIIMSYPIAAAGYRYRKVYIFFNSTSTFIYKYTKYGILILKVPTSVSEKSIR